MNKNFTLIIKTISWRVLGTLATILISFMITGDIYFGLSIGVAEFITKTILFFLHEKVWERISNRKETKLNK